jgi:hypothetical protein
MFRGWNTIMAHEVGEKLRTIPVWKLIIYIVLISILITVVISIADK